MGREAGSGMGGGRQQRGPGGRRRHEPGASSGVGREPSSSVVGSPAPSPGSKAPRSRTGSA